jgi:hypothetical protein
MVATGTWLANESSASVDLMTGLNISGAGSSQEVKRYIIKQKPIRII